MVTESGFSRSDILEILEDVKDPEVPVLSVVELGIVRDVVIDESGVTVIVTPTYSGCPAMREIEDDIRVALTAHGVASVQMRTVYTPAWTTDWMSAAAKRKLEAYGIAPPGKASHEPLVSIGRHPPADRPHCPYCGSADTEIRSEFGATACKSVCYCNGCRQPFEQFKAF